MGETRWVQAGDRIINLDRVLYFIDHTPKGGPEFAAGVSIYFEANKESLFIPADEAKALWSYLNAIGNVDGRPRRQGSASSPQGGLDVKADDREEGS